MRREKLNFDKFHRLDLFKLVTVNILLTVCLTAGSMAQQLTQKGFPSPEDASNAFHWQRKVTTKKRCSRSWDQRESKSSLRVMKLRMPKTALISSANTGKCTVS